MADKKIAPKVKNQTGTITSSNDEPKIVNESAGAPERISYVEEEMLTIDISKVVNEENTSLHSDTEKQADLKHVHRTRKIPNETTREGNDASSTATTAQRAPHETCTKPYRKSKKKIGGNGNKDADNVSLRSGDLGDDEGDTDSAT